MSKFFYRLIETTPPAAEPLSLTEAKTHLRVTHTADDDLITGLVVTARLMCEAFTGRAFMTRNISLYLDSWPQQGNSQWWDGMREGAGVLPASTVLRLPRAPLYAVTDIRVYAENGDISDFAASGYFVDTAGSFGRIVLTDTASPPSPGRLASGIEIRYIAGYGEAASDVPAPLREAVRQTVAHLYAHRGDDAALGTLPPFARGLLQPYRVMEGL